MTIRRTILNATVRLGPQPYRLVRAIERMIRSNVRERFDSHIAFYKGLLPNGALCYDVGANIGEKSESLLRAGMRVVAFEPNGDVIPELVARVGDHPDWRLITAGAHCEPAILRFFARASSGHSGFNKYWETSEITQEVLVPAVPLDYVALETGRPFYVKIDVEGWELEVLRGLSFPVPMLSFEFHLHDDLVNVSRECIRRLLELSPSYEANIAPAEQARFLWSDWRPLADVLNSFPGDLRSALPDQPYGDIYVRQSD